MRTITESIAVAALWLVAATAAAQDARYGFGARPSQQELAQYIAVLPDGRGLPPGSGSVSQGRKVYAEHCASCHGENLDGGQGDRLIGGRGTLVKAHASDGPVKTVESYWPYATTLFDYVKRAMPFTAPRSLSDDEVYAVSAYILSRANIVPADATLDAKSLARVRMPNRDGFVPDPRPEKFPSPATTPHERIVLDADAK